MDSEENAIRKFLDALDNMMDMMAKGEGGSWQEKARRLTTLAEDEGREANLEELGQWLVEEGM